MKKARLSDAANADLKAIADFFDNKRLAKRVIGIIVSRCKMLASNSGLGRERPELGTKLRSFVAGDYIIYFVAIPHGVRIARVFHGSRDITAQDFAFDSA
jgi:toxin ParE1/3/4